MALRRGGRRLVGARRLARPRLPDSESGGSAIPREPRADKNGVPDRLRSGDLLHEGQACWLDYTTGTIENSKLQTSSSRETSNSMHQTRSWPSISMSPMLEICCLELIWNLRFGVWSFQNGVPSRTLTSNLEFRTLPLCALSYGDKESRQRETELSVFSRPSRATALAAENSRVLLLMQPLEELLETSVGKNCFHGIKRVPKFIMTPGLVDEILAGMARRHDLGPAFAARDHMMSPRRDLSLTENARLGHKIFVRSIANQRSIENG
jgi:hypothetical protein